MLVVLISVIAVVVCMYIRHRLRKMAEDGEIERQM